MTAGTSYSLEFWVPKGANRFHFAGGARYVHGGAMLQEIVVPIVTVKGLRGVEKPSKVNVSLLGTVKKIVNNMQRFEFIQTEAISEKVRPVTMSVSLRDDADQLISNEITLTFDSASDQMNDRKTSASLIVKSGPYDKKREFYLVMRDTADNTEIDRIPLTIDLSFGNEF